MPQQRRTRTPRKRTRRTATAPAEPPPEDCADLPLDEEASLVLSRKARVLLYERRAAAKRALFHPGDLAARTAEAEKVRDGLPAGLTK